MNIEKLMRPSSVVVIGASDKNGMPGGATASSIKGANAERVYFLNPRRDELYGRKCYHSLKELPEIPECMLICTPSHTVIPYVEEAGRMGIGACVVLASGFSEERTQRAQQLSAELREICLKYDIALCGPNCIGIVNGIDNICVTANNDETMTMLVDDGRRGAGVIAQSGYISSGFNNPDCDHLAMVVSAGNSIVCGLEDYMLFMANEDRVNCIAAYIEGITKPDVLEKALRTAAEKRKPVIVLKAGSSAKGGFAAASHTGSLAGNHRIIQSIFRKFGVIITNSLQELVSTTRMFAVLDGNYPQKAALAGINFSGGENTLCADTAERYGIKLPDFSEDTLQSIKSVVPSFATAANPLDATTSLFSETALVRDLFQSVSADESIGLIAVGNDVGNNSEPKDLTCSSVLSQMQKEGILKPCVIIPSFEKARNAQVRKTFEQCRIPVLSTGEYAYMAIKHLMDFVTFDPKDHALSLPLPDRKAKNAIKPAPLSEKLSKEIIAETGIQIPEQRHINAINELQDLPSIIPFPWVMKVDSESLPHKTEAGGVVTNINNTDEAARAFQDIITSCKNYKPDAVINGILVEEQVPEGQEMIIGVITDKMFGPILLCGQGGVRAELYNDTAICPCPVNEKEAMEMLKSLKIWPIFEGYRGMPPLDAKAMCQAMVTVSEYAASHKNDLAELDLNPVFVYPKGKGVCAVDALIVLNSDDLPEDTLS